MAENLAKLCPAVLWKVKLIKHELRYLAEGICVHSVEGAAWVFLAASSSKKGEERGRLREELLSKMKPELDS